MRAMNRLFYSLIMLFAFAALPQCVLAETLRVSKVRFLSANRAEVFFQTAFPQNQDTLTFKVVLNPSPEAIALFQRTLTFQIGQLNEKGSFVEALPETSEVTSASISANPGHADGAEITVRRNSTAAPVLLRLSFLTDSVSIATDYRRDVDPFAVNFDCETARSSCLTSRSYFTNSTRSQWGGNEPLRIEGYGLPVSNTGNPDGPPVTAVGGSRVALFKSCAVIDQKIVLKSSSIDPSAVSYPVLTVRLTTWPEEFVTPGEIRFQRTDDPTVVVSAPAVYTGNATADKTTFLKAQKELIELGSVTEIEAKRIERFYNQRVDKGHLSRVGGRLTTMTLTPSLRNPKTGQVTVTYITENGWGEVTGIDPHLKPTPTASRAQPYSLDKTLDIFEKSAETRMDLRLEGINELGPQLAKIAAEVTRALGSADSQLGDSPCDASVQKLQLSVLDGTLAAMKDFAQASVAKRSSINERIRQIASEVETRTPQQIDAEVRRLMELRTFIDKITADVVRQYNEDVVQNKSSVKYIRRKISEVNAISSL